MDQLSGPQSVQPSKGRGEALPVQGKHKPASTFLPPLQWNSLTVLSQELLQWRRHGNGDGLSAASAAPTDVSEVKGHPSASRMVGDVHVPRFRFPTHSWSWRMLFAQRSGVNDNIWRSHDLEKTQRTGNFSGKSLKSKKQPEVTGLN